VPIHDWTRVEPGIFHDFHHAWIEDIKRALNHGLLPADFYALAEQITSGFGPDVVTLQAPKNGTPGTSSPGATVALADSPPQTWYETRAEIDIYTSKAKVIAIHHTSDHRVVAVVEIVSPGNKNRLPALRQFVDKAAEFIWAGVHLLVIDLFPPSPRDPNGIHKAIWDQIADQPFTLPEDKPLTVASYVGGSIPVAYVEPFSVGSNLPNMPLFLTPRVYVPTPLEETYQSAWNQVPAYWRNVLAGAAES
jgi:hypothetical protein